jgi:radical SAM protein (TIGR01212 family)
LKNKYGTPTYRIGVDGGFSCPNRGADRRDGGCSFCDEFGSQAAYQRDWSDLPRSGIEARLRSVRRQIKTGALFLEKRYATRSFILYFQAFSSTFGPVEELKAIYDTGLGCLNFRELVISTRPDCITPENAALIGSYVRDDFDVWVELGLQSANDGTLKRIGRGHTSARFDYAAALLRSCGIKVAAHVIFGLPGEGRKEILNTVRRVTDIKVDGIKIHDLHIPRNSRLFGEYLRGELSAPAPRRHLEYVVETLEKLPPNTVIMRLTCDTPVHSRGLPLRPVHKGVFVQMVREALAARTSYQGRLYKSG